jgi:uncharacterized OsmC-like protein
MNKTLVEVNFPGDKRVDARVGKFQINTDQSARFGGGESAPEPFQLFLASLGTCAGIYALSYCQNHGIHTDGMSLRMACQWDDEKGRYTKMSLHLSLPVGFPEKYRKAVIRSMDLCAVKKHMMDPPVFEISAS